MHYELLRDTTVLIPIYANVRILSTASRFALFFCQPPSSAEEVARLIGDRSDPEFERQFLSNSDDVPSASIDALFANF